jgi:16S rRNA (cytidine1402-2'-O)-methyltransferase
MLYIIATPIGNLKDITFRALETFKSVNFILCEDTRVTQKLLNSYEITGKKLISYHQHSSPQKVQEVMKLISENDVALVTDAGTPGISDPGNLLISELIRNNIDIQIIPIPGASALISALSISGLPTDNFLFKGFIPHKNKREKFLKECLDSKITVVFYESCHRIVKCLEQINSLSENSAKQLVVCRELTKQFETIYRGSADKILNQLKAEFPNSKPKGEFVVIVGN